MSVSILAEKVLFLRNILMKTLQSTSEIRKKKILTEIC